MKKFLSGFQTFFREAMLYIRKLIKTISPEDKLKILKSIDQIKRKILLL